MNAPVENTGLITPDSLAKIDAWVAALKLKTMGVKIDKLTAEQKKYLASWEMGT